MAVVFVLNGPNLNLLGKREPEIYGYTTLAEIEHGLVAAGQAMGLGVDFRQTNHEGVLVDWIQEAREKAAGIIINPAAFTHTSVAILDALSAFSGPIVEVHLSNIHKREPFRHHSYVSRVATGVICGLGGSGYQLALRWMAETLAEPDAGAHWSPR
ncbi:type II 3-dehydroquinate dehydratase [Rhodoligotrophos defluvii]|uniref:type II 3-dehydroquinate dehydratase n=1 Tax=Rhodoligotrophos defluvii TaxID=2561934 RepID=UPI0010CA043A|nr:type II 3-dehydroquinate dehydratase [Rhodoligotrophos defluvii]